MNNKGETKNKGTTKMHEGALIIHRLKQIEAFRMVETQKDHTQGNQPHAPKGYFLEALSNPLKMKIFPNIPRIFEKHTIVLFLETISYL